MAEHIFLTGDIQIGKSTILMRYLAAHSNLRVGGFRTVWKNRWGDGCSTFHIISATENQPLTESNCVGLRKGQWPERVCEDYSEIYDTTGVELLKNGGPYDLYLMDEIGPGENNAVRFQEAVMALLDGDTPIIGVVRDKPGVLPDRVRSHPKVKVITVTLENRDEIVLP